MRKITFIKDRIAPLCLALCALTVSALFTGCPSADGLHNQQALMVTFEFTGFGDFTADCAVPGNFDGSNGWVNTNLDVAIKKGEGTTLNPVPVTISNIQFSLVPVNEWSRPWYKEGELEGNATDKGVMHNFYINDLDLNAGEMTIVVDASSGTATVEVK